MTNRRHEQTRKRRRAPADPADVFVDSPSASPRRGFWAWAATTFKLAAGAGLLLSSVFGISWGIYRYAKTTPRFSVKSIQIEGTKRLSKEDVLAASGLSPGKNLFALDIEAAQKSLIQSPWIERARIARRLPNDIIVEVHEREARATMVVGGKSFLIDANGEPFKEVGLGDPHDLPLVTGVSLEALAESRSLEHERLRDVLSLLQTYDHLPVARDYPPEEVHLEPSGHLTLIVGSQGTTLHLGPPPFKQRLLRAERVLLKTLRSGAAPSVVFLDNEAHPERVVVRVQ